MAARTQDNLAQWSNLPDELFERAGLRMDTLNLEQQQAAMAVLQAALSPEGYTQVQQITAADGVLAESGGPDLGFGADRYWVRFVGEPSASSPYTVQFGGHHLAVNATVVGSELTLAPTLWGAQPASYEAAGATTEPLSGETRKAFALMGALEADQQEQAILDASMAEIVLGAGQDGKTLAPEGVPRAGTNWMQTEVSSTIGGLSSLNNARFVAPARQHPAPTSADNLAWPVDYTYMDNEGWLVRGGTDGV
jgi:hypothetical protein